MVTSLARTDPAKLRFKRLLKVVALSRTGSDSKWKIAGSDGTWLQSKLIAMPPLSSLAQLPRETGFHGFEGASRRKCGADLV